MKTEPNDTVDIGIGYQTFTNQQLKKETRQISKGGLTKREYFAAMAMQGLLHNYNENGQFGNHVNFPMVAEIAVSQSDALIKALNEEP